MQASVHFNLTGVRNCHYDRTGCTFKTLEGRKMKDRCFDWINRAWVEINKTTIQKVNKPRSGYLKKTNKIDKPLTRLIKKKRTQINKNRNKRGVGRKKQKWNRSRKNWQHRNTKDYKIILYPKLDNLKEMGKFLETDNLPKLNKKDTENLNRLMTANGI